MSYKTPETSKQAKRALISVSDKHDITSFCKALISFGYEIVSTGGTYKQLLANDVPVTEVRTVTEFPEIMDGRVKTLHPKIHGGILSRGEVDKAVLQEHQIQEIDLVAVNLYPFQQTIAKPNVRLADAIENIDIGGPAMIRAAAKNHDRVTVVVEPSDYNSIIEHLKENNGCTQIALRKKLAAKAFAHTAAYDAAICGYLSSDNNIDESTITEKAASNESTATPLPQHLVLPFEKIQTMRYGENPHQAAAFYANASMTEQGGLAGASVLQGKPLSYNNIADADAALETVKSFENPACVIVKHANPCGVAVRSSLIEAYQAAYETDPNSAFGGIIAFNKPLDVKTASKIISQQFVEVIIAPEVTKDALSVLTDKPNIRVLSTGDWYKSENLASRFELKTVSGGLLVQSSDTKMVEPDSMEVVSERTPSKDEWKDLNFAWKVVKFVKSNAIVYAKDEQTIGIGAGQMSRVYSAKIASIKAEDEGLTVAGSVMASDAFFPFRDTIDNAAKAGIKAIIQPGGSMRDKEVIEAANEYQIAMIFTRTRHFRH